MTRKLKTDKLNTHRRALRSLDPQKYIRYAQKYYNNELNWLKQLFSSIKSRAFATEENRKKKVMLGCYNCYFTFDEFLQFWAAHKKRYGGMYCGYTGVLMTHERCGVNDPLKNHSNNISVDRIDPYKPYTKENIIFCTVKFNNLKGSITYNDCLLILQKFIELNKH